MAIQTISQLLALAATVRDETGTGLNTATRVGQLILDAIDRYSFQDKGDYTGATITIDRYGVFNDLTLSGNTEFNFAETGHQKDAGYLIFIISDGSYTLTFNKPIAYNLYIDSSLTNGGTLPSGNYLFGMQFTGGSIKIGYTTMSSVAGDVTAPTLSTATVENAAPTQIVLTYDETLDATSTPATTDFTTSPVKTVSTVVVSGTTVTITVSVAFAYSDTITLDYTAGANPIQDPSGNDAANLSGESVTNNITAPPTLTSATIENATDSVLDLVFDEAVTITTAGWNIDTDGAALSISSVLSGSGTTTPKLQLSRSVLGTETLNVDYSSVTGATVSVATGLELETFADTAVTNNVATTIIVMQDNFAGTTLDTGKWTLTNPNTPYPTLSQNETFRITSTIGQGTTSGNADYIRSILTITEGAIQIDFTSIDNNGYAGTGVQIWVDINNRISLIPRASGASYYMRAFVTVAGVNEYAFDPSTVTAYGKAWKITVDASNNIKFWYWGGASWTQFGTTQTFNIGTTKYCQIYGVNSNTGDSYLVQYDNFYLTNADYATSVPT